MARTSSRALGGLFVLTAINFLNYADRYVVGGIQELIKHDTGLLGGERDAAGLLTDGSLGQLTTAFVVVYLLTSPLTGYLGDRIPRKYLVGGGVFVWSLATIASGLAPTYGWLLLARALIGVGEAGYATVAPSLLADFFRKDLRGKVVGVFFTAMPIGAAAGFAIGAKVGVLFGWRHAFYVAGIPGMALAIIALFMHEPERGAHDDPSEKVPQVGLVDTLKSLLGNKAYLFNTAGMTLMTFAVGGLGMWMPSFLSRTSGMSLESAGFAFGVITVVTGVIGTLAGTWLGEKAHGRFRNPYFLVSGIGLVGAAPFVFLTSAGFGSGPTLAFISVALTLILLNTGPLNTALVNAVPPSMRAIGNAGNILLIHLLGDAASPWLVGKISDVTGSLAMAVAFNAVPVLVGGIVLLIGARRTGNPTPPIVVSTPAV